MTRVPMNTLRRTTFGVGVLLTIGGLLGTVGAILDPAASSEVVLGGCVVVTVGGGLALVPLSRSRDSLPLRIAATFAGSSFGLLLLLVQTVLAELARTHAADPDKALPFGADTSVEFVLPAVLWYLTMVVSMWFLSRFAPGRAAPARYPRTPAAPSSPEPAGRPAGSPAGPESGAAGQPYWPQPGPGPAAPASGGFAQPAQPFPPDIRPAPVPFPEPDHQPAPANEPEPSPAPVPAPAPGPAPVFNPAPVTAPVSAPAPPAVQPEPDRHLGLTRGEWFTVGMTLLAAVLSTAGSVLANVLTK